jgi:amino acid adenylation domain-containing protein
MEDSRYCAQEDAPQAAPGEVRRAAGSRVYPASQVQRQFWLLHQLAPASPAYNLAQAFRLRGPLDEARLVRRLRQMVTRHEILRTAFRTVGEQLVQVVSAEASLDVPTVDLTGLPAGEQETRLQEQVQAEAVRPFDLEHGPLLRAVLLRRADTDHVLIVTMHHIITDLQALQQFFRELGQLYDGAELPAPAGPQPGEYALGEQSWLGGEEFAAMLEYWQQRLQGQDGLLALPTDRPRPVVQSFRGRSYPVSWSGAEIEALQRWARREGIPWFVLLLSAYAVLLHRYTRQTPILVGVPFTNRRQGSAAQMLGGFVNVLPLAIAVSGDGSFRDLTREVRQTMLEAHRRQEVTVARMVERLKLARDLSRNPLYQVGFTFAPPASLTLAPVAVEPLAVELGSAQLDLFMTLWEQGEGVQGRIEYSTDLFEEATIARWAGHYRTLLSSLAREPDRPLASLAILPDPERTRLLHEWNATDMPRPSVCGVHQLFEAQARRTPEATAVVCEEDQLTYGQLNRRANQLAHLLGALGVDPDVPVGIYMERSIDMLIGLLGILKAGGAYLPVDPEFPQERIDYMLDHSQVSVILTQERLEERLGRPGATTICLDTGGQILSRESDQDPPNKIRGENLAYVIYTSGSTGKPKGVQIPHGAVVNFLASMQREPGLTAHDVLLAVTTLSFDISVLELFLPLAVGARTVIVSREVASDGRRILEALERHRVTVMQATPATWRLMIAAGWTGSDRLKVLCGGEAMPKDLASDLLPRAAGVWNMYGPTETTVWSTCHRLTDPEESILIGRPIANTQIYILDARRQPVPIGVPGEIYIGGAGVTRGYLKAPDLTAERFVAHPLTADPKDRLYKTGDFGRYRHDGNIEFLGRMDNQVKVRGFRIELGEIETVLAQHAQVYQAAVVTRTDAHGNVRLVAYVVPTAGDRPALESLREFLQDRLPYYMVPEWYVLLDGLPLTPNGKVDKKALPEPDYTRPEMEQAYVAPATDYEKVLSNIWSQVLGLDRIGVHDNFFDLGGNSLLGIQAVTHIRRRLGVAIPVVKLFQCPTIAALAKCLGRDEGDPTPMGMIETRAQRRRAALSRPRPSVQQPDAATSSRSPS